MEDMQDLHNWDAASESGAEIAGHGEFCWDEFQRPVNPFHVSFLENFIRRRTSRDVVSLPEDVVQVLQELNLSDGAQVLLGVKAAIEGYLGGTRKRHVIQLGVFSDHEFPDWKAIKIVVGVDDDLARIFEDIRPRVYDAVSRMIPRELLGKVFVEFESLREH